MKAPVFSAYAPSRAAAAATLNTLASTARHDEQPATINCPQCNGAGCQHDVPPGQPVHGGDIYECYHCEVTG